MEESDGDVAARHNYKAVPNNTNSKWWLDPGMHENHPVLPAQHKSYG